MTLLRRFLVIAALMFWQGGFTFYASVVVPIGQSELGHFRQGLITRQVANYLNLAGAVALLPLLWDAAVSSGGPTRQRLRLMSWLGMAAALGVLTWMHAVMGGLIDAEAGQLFDRQLFRVQHRSYLWVSTAQWACAIVYLILALHDWRRADAGRSATGPDPPPVPKGASKGEGEADPC